MISSAEEFIALRQSEKPEDYFRAANEPSEISVWMDVIRKFPEFKIWVIHNKTIQIEILESLLNDPDANVRSEVARKRKINGKIFEQLSQDPDVNVRYALMCNTKLPPEKKKEIKTEDSIWLQEKLAKIVGKS